MQKHMFDVRGEGSPLECSWEKLVLCLSTRVLTETRSNPPALSLSQLTLTFFDIFLRMKEITNSDAFLVRWVVYSCSSWPCVITSCWFPLTGVKGIRRQPRRLDFAPRVQDGSGAAKVANGVRFQLRATFASVAQWGFFWSMFRRQVEFAVMLLRAQKVMMELSPDSY